MAKYRVHFDIRNPKNTGGTSSNVTVDADSDHIAVQIAEGKYKSGFPHARDYTFNVKRIEKLKD